MTQDIHERTAVADALAEEIGASGFYPMRPPHLAPHRWLGLKDEELFDYEDEGHRDANASEISRMWDWDDETGAYVEVTS